MKTTIKINSIYGKLLFEYECEENSIKKTVEQAVREEINLRSANLICADLSCADLRSANLSCAYLSYADLSCADLSCADLRSANLSCADLSYADLSCADLSCADLSYADLTCAKNKKTATLPIFCKWNASVIGDKIKIGCKEMTIENWDSFFQSSEEFETKRNTKEFKQIQAVYLAYKAYLTFLK